MKSLAIFMILCGAPLLGAGAAMAEDIKTPVHKINEQGVGEKIGYITFSDGPKGLMLKTDLMGLPPGPHGMHIHEVGNCAPTMVDGKPMPGGSAKGHYDPEKTGRHMGPMGEGHKGDLPVLQADAHGKAKATLTAPHLKLADIRNRAIVIHAGGDNYSDMPSPLGGGGARIACGVIRNGM